MVHTHTKKNQTNDKINDDSIYFRFELMFYVQQAITNRLEAGRWGWWLRYEVYGASVQVVFCPNQFY